MKIGNRDSWLDPVGSIGGTRTIYVGKNGVGNFGTIKEAVDWLAANTTLTFSSGTIPTHRGPYDRWTVIVTPGIYTESAFMVPPFTTLCGSVPASISTSSLLSYPVKVLGNITAGVFITLADASLVGLDIEIAGTPTAPVSVVKANADAAGSAFYVSTIRGCAIKSQCPADVHEVVLVDTFQDTVLATECNLIAQPIDCTNLTLVKIRSDANYGGVSLRRCELNCHGSTPAAAVSHAGGEIVFVSFCQIGQANATGPTFVKDFVRSGTGPFIVQQSPYKTSQGTITNGNWVPA